MRRAPSVGIIGQASYIPRLCMEMPTVFVPGRGKDPGKYNRNVGILESSLPDLYDDPVSMASTAALWVMENYQIDPSEIGRIAVGTESSFDNSKSMAAYVVGNLETVYGQGEFRNVRSPETKSACIGATFEVDNAANWILTGKNWGRKALVVATDIALYEQNHPGEGTQGAYATAMIIGDVEEEGGLVEFSLSQGEDTEPFDDFLKPEMSKYPSVDSVGSIIAYWYTMSRAIEDYEGKARRSGIISRGQTTVDAFDRIFYHQPFPEMERTMGAGGYWHAIRDTELGKRLEKTIGEVPKTPNRLDYTTFNDWFDAMRVWWTGKDEQKRVVGLGKAEQLRRLAETPEFIEFYRSKIEPATFNNVHLGNGYTASVHEARTSVFDHAREHGVDLKRKLFLVGSYGSGAQAEVHDETVMEDYLYFADKLNTREQLKDRRKLTFDEYLALRQGVIKEPFSRPRRQFVWTGRFGNMGQRLYAFVEKEVPEPQPRGLEPRVLARTLP